jgi:hypothetical protein
LRVGYRSFRGRGDKTVEQRPLWIRHQLAQVIAGGIRLELPQDLGLAAAAGDLERRLKVGRRVLFTHAGQNHESPQS